MRCFVFVSDFYKLSSYNWKIDVTGVCHNILLFSASFTYRVIQSTGTILKLVIPEISWAENNPSPPN
jgi:hypothetical protein